MTKAGTKTSKGQAGTKSPFEKKLRAKCKNCSNASIIVYLAAIKRLHRLIGDGDIPDTGSWLKKKELMEKYNKLPLSKRRHLSLAGVKASQAYGIKGENWGVKMFRDQSQYQSERSQNKRSETEQKKWPKHGFTAIKKATTEQRKRITHILKESPKLKNLYPYQIYMLFKLYSEIPFRNTFADLNLEVKSKNYVRVPKKGRIVFEMKHYKNSKQLGESEITLSRGATTALRKFLKFRGEVVDHDWLFSGKSGGKLSRPALGKLLHRATKQLLGKAFGSRLIRVLAATDSRKAIEEVSELSKKMLHTTAQTKQYVRKTKGAQK